MVTTSTLSTSTSSTGMSSPNTEGDPSATQVWLYRRAERRCWTVGYFDPAGHWQPEGDHLSATTPAVARGRNGVRAHRRVAGRHVQPSVTFRGQAEPVRGVWHDGSPVDHGDAQVALVAGWVQQVADGREVRVEVEPGPVLVIQPAWPAEPLRLRPGMFLVLRSAGWTVYSAEQFLAAFEPLPRELPIFDDGEVA